MYRNGILYTGDGSEFPDMSNMRGEGRGQQVIAGKYGAVCGTMDGTISCKDFFTTELLRPGTTTYLEVGAFDGIVVALLAERFPDKRFIAIDAFCDGALTGGGSERYFVQNCRELDNVYLLSGRSEEVLYTIHEPLDVVFLDGDHSYATVWNDAEYLWPLIVPFGVLAFHDYPFPGVHDAIDEFCTKYGLELVHMDQLCYVRKV